MLARLSFGQRLRARNHSSIQYPACAASASSSSSLVRRGISRLYHWPLFELAFQPPATKCHLPISLPKISKYPLPFPAWGRYGGIATGAIGKVRGTSMCSGKCDSFRRSSPFHGCPLAIVTRISSAQRLSSYVSGRSCSMYSCTCCVCVCSWSESRAWQILVDGETFWCQRCGFAMGDGQASCEECASDTQCETCMECCKMCVEDAGCCGQAL